MPKNPAIDAVLAAAPEYARPILKRLRQVVHSAGCGLAETLKWGAPTFERAGLVCAIHAFKDYVGIWFHKGALLPDPKKLLQRGSSARTMKVIHFTSTSQIDVAGVKALVREAVKANEGGVRPAKNTARVVVPAPLRRALAKNAKARAFYESLAPSHRREYARFIAEAKRPETVDRRLAKTIGELEKGLRPHDTYRA